MKLIKIIGLVVVAVSTFSFASTALAVVPFPSGWYIQGNAGVTKVSGTSYGAGASTTSNGPSINLIAGYKYNPFFAGEVGYTKYTDVKIKNSARTQAGTNKVVSADIAGVGILPIGVTGFELFAKLGVSLLRSKVSISDADAASTVNISSGTHNVSNVFIGAGFDYSFCANIPINFQWQRARGDQRSGDLDLYSVGVAYIFS